MKKLFHHDKLLFILALAILAAAFIRDGKIPGKRIKVNPPPSLVFAQWWEDDLEKDALTELVREFESLHKGIKITLNRRSYEELRNDLFNSVETASLGDIIAVDPLWIPELRKSEIIESRREGNAEAPLLSFINVLYYNTEILREAGYSKPPKSRGEFLDYARAIAGTGKNRRGLAMGGNSSRWIYDDVFPWIWSAGTELIKDGRPVVNSKSVIESLAFLSALEREGLIIHGAPDGVKGAKGAKGAKADAFISGRAVFMIAPASCIKPLRERMGEDTFNITAVPPPDNYAGKTYFSDAAWAVGINAASAYREEAASFADFLAEKARFLSEKAPAFQEDSSAPLSSDPVYSKLWDIAITGEKARDFAGLPWTELEKIFREEISALLMEKTSPAEAAGAIQEKTAAVLEPALQR